MSRRSEHETEKNIFGKSGDARLILTMNETISPKTSRTGIIFKSIAVLFVGLLGIALAFAALSVISQILIPAAILAAAVVATWWVIQKLSNPSNAQSLGKDLKRVGTETLRVSALVTIKGLRSTYAATKRFLNTLEK